LREVAAQEMWISELAMTRDKLDPELRPMWPIAHAPNENKLSRGYRERG
jgi:hypothetical protein